MKLIVLFIVLVLYMDAVENWDYFKSDVNDENDKFNDNDPLAVLPETSTFQTNLDESNDGKGIDIFQLLLNIWNEIWSKIFEPLKKVSKAVTFFKEMLSFTKPVQERWGFIPGSDEIDTDEFVENNDYYFIIQ